MYKARLFFDTAEDVYNEGELPNGTGTSWTDEATADTAAALKDKITDIVGLDWQHFTREDINEYPTAAEYWSGYLANENNTHATSAELEAWRQGKQKLWSVTVHILVSKVAEAKATL